MYKIPLFILMLLFTHTAIAQENTITVSKAETITVSTADELVNAIAPNRTILVEPGDYQLRQVKALKDLEVEDSHRDIKITDYVTYDSGLGITIRKVTNLTIKGTEKEAIYTKLLTEDLGDNVLTFINCIDVNISNVKAEHFPATKGGCQGGVFSVQGCSNMTIDNNILSGSGILAITVTKSENISCTNSTLEECTSGIMEVHEAKNVTFSKCLINNNYSHYGFISIRGSENVAFNSCTISNNYTEADIPDYAMKYDGLIRAKNNKDNVLFEKCVFDSNTIGYFCDSEEKLTLKKCKEKDNKFGSRVGGK
jgi:hypothetical protein